MNSEFAAYQHQLDALTVFSTLKQDPVIRGLRRLFAGLSNPESRSCTEQERPDKGDAAKGNLASDSAADLIALYSDVLAALYPATADLSVYLQRIVLADDNFYVRAVAAGRPLSEEIQMAVRRELSILENLAALPCRKVQEVMNYDGYLPAWSNSSIHLLGDFTKKLRQLPVTGYGIFARHHFFRFAGGEILPVTHPDVQPLSRLFGYAHERELVIRNTEALLSGEPASNMLLYGDAGTGKSTTIKAMAAEYANRGLRLIEIKKDQLLQIPGILEELSDNPLKFILFIDDLSFAENDDNFSALKAALEGSVAGRSANTVIYATSNRRHLVRETFSGRGGDEIHVNDSLQETMSLAARFGLAIAFQKPGREEYVHIVRALADEAGIDISDEELARKAEAHAIRRNGRSPRTARQFVELLQTGLA